MKSQTNEWTNQATEKARNHTANLLLPTKKQTNIDEYTDLAAIQPTTKSSTQQTYWPTTNQTAILSKPTNKQKYKNNQPTNYPTN